MIALTVYQLKVSTLGKSILLIGATVVCIFEKSWYDAGGLYLAAL